MSMYQLGFVAGAGDFDFDGRFRGAALLDRAKDVRMRFFAEHGFPVDILRKQRLMPMALKDRLDYQRDIEAFDEYKISLALSGLSDDGSRFAVRCDVIRADGKAAAKIISTCAWLDSALQKFTNPPPQLVAALKQLPLSSDYQTLLSALK